MFDSQSWWHTSDRGESIFCVFQGNCQMYIKITMTTTWFNSPNILSRKLNTFHATIFWQRRLEKNSDPIYVCIYAGTQLICVYCLYILIPHSLYQIDWYKVATFNCLVNDKTKNTIEESLLFTLLPFYQTIDSISFRHQQEQLNCFMQSNDLKQRPSIIMIVWTSNILGSRLSIYKIFYSLLTCNFYSFTHFSYECVNIHMLKEFHGFNRVMGVRIFLMQQV